MITFIQRVCYRPMFERPGERLDDRVWRRRYDP